MASFPYDASTDPPAPVVPIRIASLADPTEVRVVSMLVDTGADCTCIPEVVARSLALPIVERASIAGIAGAVRRVALYEASIELATFRIVVPVVGLDDEAIVGRDVLRRIVLTLDGPRGRATLQGVKPRGRR